MKVAHFAKFDPCRSGQFATVRDLIFAERALGIDAGFIDSDGCSECHHWYSNPGQKNGALETLPYNWSKDADVLVRHTAFPQELEKTEIPVVMCLHGRPQSTFALERAGKKQIYSFLKGTASKDKKYRCFVTFWEEFLLHLSFLLPKDRLFYVPAPVDLELYKPEGDKINYEDLSGSPNIMIADLWREDSNPYNLLHAAVLFKEKYCKDAKLHMFGIPDAKPGALAIIMDKIRQVDLLGKAYHLHPDMASAYRAADFLITQHHIATRIVREALACGLPIVADSDCKYTQYTANPKCAEKFAAEMKRCWKECWDVVDKGNSILSIEKREACRDMATKEFNPENSAKAMIKVFERALEPFAEKWANKGRFKSRTYDDYSEYIEHQKSKLNKRFDFIKQYNTKYRTQLLHRLRKLNFLKSGMSVLCLGARLGAEVQAFTDVGCFAIGIDLNPGAENKYVVTGDFHKLEQADSSADVVFTNSIDHVFDFDKFINEINRVLKLDGSLIIELVSSHETDEWNSLKWSSAEELLAELEQKGFSIQNRHVFKSGWFTEQVCLRKGIAQEVQAESQKQQTICMSTLGGNGGFGNQIFQYAALCIYGIMHNLKVEVPDSWEGRKLFEVPYDSISHEYWGAVEFKHGDNCIFKNNTLVNKNIIGFFQYHTSLYAPHKKFFKSLFVYQLELLKKAKEEFFAVMNVPQYEAHTLIGIHIRRGDYGKGKFHIAPIKWYLKWLKENWLKLESPSLFIASDEIEDVTKEFEAYKPLYMKKGCEPFIDHYILRHCRYLLTSNSSFSFTAAMLNDNLEKSFRPDFEQHKLVEFNPWNAEPFLRQEYEPAEAKITFPKSEPETNGEIKLALVYNKADHKLLPSSYSQTYRHMFDALGMRFPNAQLITEDCSAQDIEANVILFYDVHSSHHIKIDGIKQHPATKYTFFNDPWQEEIQGRYPDQTFVHKLGAAQRVNRALERGVQFIICPYTDGYYKHIAPRLGDAAEDMLVWFPVAPKDWLHSGISALEHRRKEVLATGFTEAGKDCSIYDFRKWAYEQKGITRVPHTLKDFRTPSGNVFLSYLSQWAGALALTNFAVVPKYLEIPLAGCLCFAQWHADYEEMGFKDNVNCVYVNELNFNDRISDFLNNVSAYQEMADAGRNLVKNNYTAKHFAEFIHEHMRGQLYQVKEEKKPIKL